MKDYDAIFMTGPQGSGKGTQAKLLAEKMGYFHWDMGRILRENKDTVTVTGETVGERIDKGIFLSDEQLIGIIKDKLKELPPDQKIIFDGLPRRIGQAEFLLDFLRSIDKEKFLIIDLKLPREISLERLKLRAEKENRTDDTEEGIRNRLAFYDEHIVPTVEYLKGHAEYIEIDGRPPIEEVQSSIEKELGINS